MNIIEGFSKTVTAEIPTDEIEWDLDVYGEVTDVTYGGSYLSAKATVTANFDEDEYLQEVKDSLNVSVDDVTFTDDGSVEFVVLVEL